MDHEEMEWLVWGGRVGLGEEGVDLERSGWSWGGRVSLGSSRWSWGRRRGWAIESNEAHFQSVRLQSNAP